MARVVPSVKPGGKLIYSVCTLTQVETSEVVDSFRTAHADFEQMVLPTDRLGNENGRALTSAATVTLWPHDFGGNGMFVAAWRKKS